MLDNVAPELGHWAKRVAQALLLTAAPHFLLGKMVLWPATITFLEAVMVRLFAGNLDVQYGQVYVELTGPFDGAMDRCFQGQNNGLCGARSPAILFLVTGLHTGVVGLSISLFDSDPGLDETWDEIVEASFAVPNGQITLVEWGAEQGIRMVLPPGSYRARYQGRAMDAASELDTNLDDIPVDTYQLDLWLSPQTGDRVVKQTSAIAAYWHDWANNLVMPAD